MKHPIQQLFIVVVLSWLAFTADGCATRTISIGGATYKSTRFGNKEQIGEVEVRQGTNVFILRGYRADQVEAIGIAAEAAARGAVSGMTGGLK